MFRPSIFSKNEIYPIVLFVINNIILFLWFCMVLFHLHIVDVVGNYFGKEIRKKLPFDYISPNL